MTTTTTTEVTLVTVPLETLLTLIDFTAAMNLGCDEEDHGHIALAWALVQEPSAVAAFVAAQDDADLVDFLTAARQLLVGLRSEAEALEVQP